MAGDAETASLAAGVPDNQVAELFEIDQAVLRGDWEGAIARIRNLPQEGLTQILSPLLLAWAEQGAGRTDAALAALQPYPSGPEARGIDALHAGMIADLAGRTALADKYYSMADQGFSGPEPPGGAGDRELAGAPGPSRRGAGDDRGTRRRGKRLCHGRAQPRSRHHRPPGEEPGRRDGRGLSRHRRQPPAGGLRTDFTVILLRLALALHPDLTPARLLLADVLDNQDQPAAALAVLATVADADPLAPIVALQQALLLDHLGKVNDALAVLDRLAAQYPDQPDPLEAKGDILRCHERWQEAITAYDGAIARVGTPGPSDWTLFYDRGIAYDQVHDWPRAEPDFQKALQLQPNQPYVLNYLGYSWAVQGRHLPEARQMIAKAAELRPNDGAILDSLG